MLVHSGYYNKKILQTGGLSTTNIISHGSRDWEVQDHAQMSGEAHFLVNGPHLFDESSPGGMDELALCGLFH